jgi:putative sterol carrier protein
MKYSFPSAEWLDAFKDKLNVDEKYATIASKWEGDILFQIDSDAKLETPLALYLDLWHGKCRDAYIVNGEEPNVAFRLNAPFSNWERILRGELQPMQALMTQKLKVKGNMAYLMRHVPTVLEFARCAQDVTKVD